MNEVAHICNPGLSNIVITAQSFGLLRKALFENLGKQKAKRFLMRFGMDLGMFKAKELIKINPSIDYLIEMAPVIHTQLGHVSAVQTGGAVRCLENNQLEIINAKGKWIDSFEAKLHLEHHGAADECSCYVLSGYASGYMSAVLQTDIFVKEITCQAKGDAECSFEVNTREYWAQNSDDDLAMYDDQTILDELEETYDELFFKNQLLDKITNFHKRLMDCIVQNKTLDHVIRTAFDILKIPVAIEDLNDNIIILHGTDQNTYQKVIKDNKKTGRTLKTYNSTTYERFGTSYLLTAPVYLENRLYAKCSFIYLQTQAVDENDYLFLERLAEASALCFLNEKIRFETAERMKISILDQLIHKQYGTIEEFSSRIKYVFPKFNGPYVTLTLKCCPRKNNQKPLDLYDQLLQFSKALKYYSLNGFLTQNQDKIVFLISCEKNQESFLKTMELVVAYVEKNNPNIQYKIGVSQPYEDLRQFESSLQQARQALDLPRQQKMVRFEELGLLGALLQGTDIQHLKETARKELGRLLDEDEKNKELLQTLYIYLVNGGRLEKTMQSLSLSIGGVQYRIRKIEEILQKDLKNFSVASYLLLLIEALIVTGELTLK
ncbi:V4R domain-containing protein [Kyrpidia sp.]|uniref:helix-turn-helix domain-containing protein n=1 Tax=Kyrpidia sp. TaxID=2073077 RepID=UPI00258C16AE|nr:V4R domain-containing protein [Kyrpidia sp.]MCL6577252.1 helix-turn-helix domain-containing protein [Kyrpidia sp.]